MRRREWIREKRFGFTRYFKLDPTSHVHAPGCGHVHADRAPGGAHGHDHDHDAPTATGRNAPAVPQGHYEGDGHIHGGGRSYSSPEELLRQNKENQTVGGNTSLAEFHEAAGETAALRGNPASGGSKEAPSSQGAGRGNASSSPPQNGRSAFHSATAHSTASSMGLLREGVRSESFGPRVFNFSSSQTPSPASSRSSVSSSLSRGTVEGRALSHRSPSNPSFSSATVQGRLPATALSNPSPSAAASGPSNSPETAKADPSLDISQAQRSNSSPTTGEAEGARGNVSIAALHQNTEFPSLRAMLQNPQVLQSLPPALRSVIGTFLPTPILGGLLIPSQGPKSLAGLAGMLGLPPQALQKALSQLSTPPRALAFQGAMPLNLTAIKLSYPNLMQRLEKTISQFGNLLFGGYLYKGALPHPLENKQGLAELALLMALRERREKEFKKEVKRVKALEFGEVDEIQEALPEEDENPLYQESEIEELQTLI